MSRGVNSLVLLLFLKKNSLKLSSTKLVCLIVYHLNLVNMNLT